MKASDVVVFGAGVIGASVAYHLAARGAAVTIVEREAAAGEGSTGRAAGGFRTQFTTSVNVRLSLLSRDKLLLFEDELEADPGYVPAGYVFLASTPQQLDLLRSALAVQHAAGVAEAQEVSTHDVLRLNPAVAPTSAIGGTFCPLDGFIRPMQILNAYLAAARRLGVRVLFGAGDARCELDGSRVVGVRTADGVLPAGCAVNAAGPWAGAVAASAGVDLPVRPLRRQVAVTAPFPLLPDAMPMTIYVDDGWHARVRDGRVLMLWPADLPAADPFDTSFDERWLAGLLSRAHSRVPVLRQARIDRGACWAGLYEMSPDKHAIVGAAPGAEGLFLVNGSSGHGVMHAPALGQLLAEMILDGSAHSVDVHALRPTRFAEGQPNPEFGIL